MKKLALYEVAFLMVVSLLMVGTVSAGDKDAMSKSGKVTLSGTINQYHQLVDERGMTFELAESEEGRELKGLIGKRVEITGTVMEEAGQNVVDVHRYKILEE